MKLTTKRRIDLYLGLPLLNLMDWAATAARLLLPARRRGGQVRKVLVVKFQGMGSLALAKPALEQLRRQHPDAHIAFWGVRGTCHLAALMPEFDEIFCLDDHSLVAAALSTLGCLVRIWRRGFDWVFDLEVYSKLSSVLATLTLARNRAGFAVALVRARRHLHTHLVVFNTYHYLGRAYSKLFALSLGDTPDDTIVSDTPRWRPSAARMPDLPPGYIVVNTHVGDLCPERAWPLEHWIELVRALRTREPELPVVLLGWGADECRANAAWPADLEVLDLGGRLPLAELIQCLEHARLVVSSDSGPLQLAVLTTTPVVGLFGPTRPLTYFPPHRPSSKSLSLDLYCSPCLHHWDEPPCAGNNQCMRGLSVAEVALWCLELLGHPQDTVAFVRPDLVDSDYCPGKIY